MFNDDLYLLDIRSLIMEEALARSIFEEECTQCPMKRLVKGKTYSQNILVITENGFTFHPLRIIFLESFYWRFHSK